MSAVVVVPYSNDWTVYFAAVRNGLLPLFGPGEVAVEHIAARPCRGSRRSP